MENLPKKHEYTLLIDDSHAFGVLGNGIFGTYSQWKNLPVNLVVSGSLGKALGLPAGIILGNQKTLSELEQHKIFRSSSPPPPGYLDAFLNGQQLYREQIEILHNKLLFFSKLIGDLKHIRGSANYPVFVFKDIGLVKNLEEKGIIVSSFSYPTARDPAVNRIVISAHHENADLSQLSFALKLGNENNGKI